MQVGVRKRPQPPQNCRGIPEVKEELKEMGTGRSDGTEGGLRGNGGRRRHSDTP